MKALWAYFSDHWSIFLLGILAGVGFLYSEKFAEFVYALLRFVVVVAASMALRDLWFKKTVRPYVSSSGFAYDFTILPPLHKVWISVVIMVSLLFASVLCFIHP